MTTSHLDDRLAAQEKELAQLKGELAKWQAAYRKQALRTDADAAGRWGADQGAQADRAGGGD